MEENDRTMSILQLIFLCIPLQIVHCHSKVERKKDVFLRKIAGTLWTTQDNSCFFLRMPPFRLTKRPPNVIVDLFIDNRIGKGKHDIHSYFEQIAKFSSNTNLTRIRIPPINSRTVKRLKTRGFAKFFFRQFDLYLSEDEL